MHDATSVMSSRHSLARAQRAAARNVGVFIACFGVLACGQSHGVTDGDGGNGDTSVSDAELDGDVLSDGGLSDGSADSSTDGATDGSDGGTPALCDPSDVEVTLCPDIDCDEGPSWYWDGDHCFPIECGACTGDDCGTGPLSEEECEAAHAECEPELCRQTGGEWMWWAPACGDYECGSPPPEVCLTPYAGCDCGPSRTFGPEGCVTEKGCPVAEPVTREELCEGTGGTWSGYCCDSVCGVYCALDCTSDACHCGDGKVFDETRGCKDAARCHERLREESCEGDARCEPGTVCCPRGGAGEPVDTCVYPVCDIDPSNDACGSLPA